MSYDRPDFTTPTFETTVKGIHDFTTAADRLPEGSPLNVGFVEGLSAADRLAAFGTLASAGLRVRPILSARRITSETELTDLIHGITEQHIRQVFITGGDPSEPAGPYTTATELIQAEPLASADLELIGLPGFPEQHPEATVQTLLDHLVTKVGMVESSGRRVEITTQVCLDPDAVADWIHQLRTRGVAAPVRIGIPAPAAADSLLRFCRLCKVEATREDLIRHGWMPDEVSMIADPAAFIDTLTELLTPDHGQVLVHLYPMGDVPAALNWLAEL